MFSVCSMGKFWGSHPYEKKNGIELVGVSGTKTDGSGELLSAFFCVILTLFFTKYSCVG